jgi:hypothetical protein
MTNTVTTDTSAVATRTDRNDIALPITHRLPEGLVQDALPPERHQELHLRMLHCRTRGLVEIAAGRRDGAGELYIYTRERPDHFLPGGGAGDPMWLERLLSVVNEHVELGDEVFVGPASHVVASANREDIHWSEWAWLDIDGSEHLGRVEALLHRKPAKARIYSAGSGGEHIYWPLRRPLPARTVTVEGRTIVNPVEVTEPTGEPERTRLVGYRDTSTSELVSGIAAVHWIEKANLRLIHSLGLATRDGREVYVADVKCRNRSRLMRLAGTVHGETGEYARISYLDHRLQPYDPRLLLGDLPDPATKRRLRRPGLRRFAPDPYLQIPADEYFQRLARIELPARGNISCPSPTHPDVKPSCSVTDYVWYCHGCGAAGTIYDLASLLDGGPTGDVLAASGPEFKRAKQLVSEAFGEL